MKTDTAEYHFKRSYKITPAQLWHLLTDPQQREQWGAPGPDMVLTAETSDLRVGGSERHRCGPADAPEFIVDTRWYRLDTAALAAFTETLIIGDDAMATSLVTYALAATEDGVDLAVTVAVSSFTGPEAPSEFHHGWEGGLANLDALIAAL